MVAIVFPFLIYWLVFFIASYSIVEFAQDQFYDEVTPRAGLKVALGSLLLALLQTWLRTSYDTMFTSDLPWTVLQGIVWFAVFTLVFQFHPQHAAAIGIGAMLLICGIATMGVESMTKPTPAQRPAGTLTKSKPVRGSLSPAAVAAPPTQKK
jgi:hypothetical protein